ncbi:MAG: HRDC domain-containing protein [Deltaproteobacteria bacterium]|nr:HRDC domain-containing protein [Deltaproteobacteria bacterium]MBW2413189.1 HRDC domain-containing protein [Deltaproteobacteria bacterium]
MADHSLIESPEELEVLARRLSREKVIAVDTEADSFYHYHEKLCLVQIGYRGGIALVDPLLLPPKGLQPLAPIFADPNVRKILHAAEYDLYVLNRYGGFRVRNLFDTMASAQLLGYPAVGLAALVERHFGVKLSKDQQRTDWSRRPLRNAQVEYAASDVRYLVELTAILEKELRAKKRLEWAQEEFLSLEEKEWSEREFDATGYMRIKGAKKLSPRGLAVLREVFLVRDARARELDRPPFKVMGNGTLLELAQKPPRSKRALSGRKGMTELVVRRLGQEVLDAVNRGLEGPEQPPPEKKPSGAPRRRLDRRAEARLDRLKRWRARRAKELSMDPGVFCPNVTLEEVAWANPESPDDLLELGPVKGWWARSFGQEVIETVHAAPAAEEGEATTPRSGGGRRKHGAKTPSTS